MSDHVYKVVELVGSSTSSIEGIVNLMGRDRSALPGLSDQKPAGTPVTSAQTRKA
jgi:hypothetical protein